MGLLLVGIYLIAVGYQGQAGNLITLLSGEGPFLPWAVACGILAWIWRATPPPGRETAHIIIGSAVLGVILLEASKIIAGLESAWGAINTIGSGTSSSSTAASGSVTISNLTLSPATSGSGNSAGTYSYAQLVQLAQNAGFTGAAADTAAAIALAESGGNSSAVNPNDPQGSYGLMQINQAAHPGTVSTALTPQGSMDLAYQISNGGTNFAPWSTYTSGAYAQYLQ